MSSTSVALRSLRDSVWLDQARYEQAEGRYQQALACRHTGSDTIAEVGIITELCVPQRPCFVVLSLRVGR